MGKKIDIGQKAKVKIRWTVSQDGYSRETEKAMISLMAKKYGIPAKNITVETNYITNGNDGVLASDVVKNIYDPKFQLELMQMYIANNKIENIDFNEIVKIDSQINSLIDYDTYDKGKRYTIKWVKWSNFLSYGPDNFFDFSTLHGLVLLNGEPANKSGKSTFAYDLLHFLLFGKTNTQKAKTLAGLFNNYLPDENTINVEGCINIDGEDYIIKRTLTRPSKGKKTKTVTSKVEYYRVNGDGTEEILPDENLQGDSSVSTSKIIKDALGNENDFDLIISANAKDLDSLISLTETEKGRLLSRWIGLSVIEDKDVKAREKWNKEISVGRYSDIYDHVKLEEEIGTLSNTLESNSKEIEECKKSISGYDKQIESYNKDRDLLLASKQTVDNSIIKVNVATLENNINTIIENGKRKKLELEAVSKSIEEIGDISFSEAELKSLKNENNTLVHSMAETRAAINGLKKTKEALATAEYCPTCHRKFENIDNSAQIEENKKAIEAKTKEGIEMKSKSDKIEKMIAEIENKRSLAMKKSQLEIKKATIETDIANGRADYKEKASLLKEIEKNKNAIAKNSEIDARVNVINENIRTEESLKRKAQDTILSLDSENSRIKESINTKKGYLVKISEEQKIERYWKLYLQMIGKDGISKMVLRNTLPIINNELSRLLDDVTDFRVEIVMNEKNDVDFLLIRDDVVTRLSAASGLEKTQAALALRVVLGKMSNLSRPPFILLDEVLGTVAKENYDDMKKLYDRIVECYDFVLHICHIDLDWYNDGDIITIIKQNNISSIKRNDKRCMI